MAHVDVGDDTMDRAYYLGRNDSDKVDFDEAITRTAERSLDDPPDRP